MNRKIKATFYCPYANKNVHYYREKDQIMLWNGVVSACFSCEFASYKQDTSLAGAFTALSQFATGGDMSDQGYYRCNHPDNPKDKCNLVEEIRHKI